jgi:hypothetical protein
MCTRVRCPHPPGGFHLWPYSQGSNVSARVTHHAIRFNQVMSNGIRVDEASFGANGNGLPFASGRLLSRGARIIRKVGACCITAGAIPDYGITITQLPSWPMGHVLHPSPTSPLERP